MGKKKYFVNVNAENPLLKYVNQTCEAENYHIWELLRTFAKTNKIRMNVIFKDKALDEIWQTRKTKDHKYKILCRNSTLVDGYQRAVNLMFTVARVSELGTYSFLHYEKLKHTKEPLSSVRIANGHVERLIFKETENGFEVELIEINDTHYGNKK